MAAERCQHVWEDFVHKDGEFVQTDLPALSFPISPTMIQTINKVHLSPNGETNVSLLWERYHSPVKRNSILRGFEVEEVKVMRRRYISLPLPPEVKEVNFKILNEIYPTNKLWRLRFNLDVKNCVFCENETESLEHLFFHCGSVFLERHVELDTVQEDHLQMLVL